MCIVYIIFLFFLVCLIYLSNLLQFLADRT